MPRFYFDLHDGPNCSHDAFGDDFEGFEEAREQAQAILAHMVGEELPDGEDRSFMCEVRDAENDVIYRCELKLHGQWVRKTAVVA